MAFPWQTTDPPAAGNDNRSFAYLDYGKHSRKKIAGYFVVEIRQTGSLMIGWIKKWTQQLIEKKF
jgi:hypothetical protein